MLCRQSERCCHCFRKKRSNCHVWKWLDMPIIFDTTTHMIIIVFTYLFWIIVKARKKNRRKRFPSFICILYIIHVLIWVVQLSLCFFFYFFLFVIFFSILVLNKTENKSMTIYIHIYFPISITCEIKTIISLNRVEKKNIHYITLQFYWWAIRRSLYKSIDFFILCFFFFFDDIMNVLKFHLHLNPNYMLQSDAIVGVNNSHFAGAPDSSTIFAFLFSFFFNFFFLLTKCHANQMKLKLKPKSESFDGILCCTLLCVPL